MESVEVERLSFDGERVSGSRTIDRVLQSCELIKERRKQGPTEAMPRSGVHRPATITSG